MPAHSSTPRRLAGRLLPPLLGLALAASTAHADTPSPAPAPMGLTGRWLTESGNAEVEIAPCGQQLLCGTIIKVLGNRSMSRHGEEMKPADTRPALGMQILLDFQREPDDEAQGAPQARWHGEIYNRENGKRYRCHLSVNGRDELIVHAYIGLPLFGKTQVWHRASALDSQAAR